MKRRAVSLEEMRERVGSELGVTAWFNVDQALMDGFGAATQDPDWMHIDPQRAAAEGPYGGTIAFGFWTLAMLTRFSHEVGMWPSDVAYGLNYGLERVRWVHPVKVGSRIRMRCELLGLEDRGEGRFLVRTHNVVEIEGVERPALVAEWLGMFVRAPT